MMVAASREQSPLYIHGETYISYIDESSDSHWLLASRPPRSLNSKAPKVRGRCWRSSSDVTWARRKRRSVAMVTVPTGLVAEVSSPGGRKKGGFVFSGITHFIRRIISTLTVSPDRVPIKERDLSHNCEKNCLFPPCHYRVFSRITELIFQISDVIKIGFVL